MASTKLLIPERHIEFLMGEQPELVEIAEKLAREEGIVLSHQPLENGTTYWTLGSNNGHTLDHTVNGEATERVCLEFGQEAWKAVADNDSQGRRAYYAVWTFLKENAPRYENNVDKLLAGKRIPVNLGNILKTVLNKAQDLHTPINPEELPDRVETNYLKLTLEELKSLPPIKEFYH